MNKTVKWILISLGILIALLVVVRLVRGPGENGLKVSVEPAARRTIVETVNASGKIYPEVEVKISPDISGEIVELNVEEGDSVRRGQVLARVYADEYSSQRDVAAAQVQQQQANVANSAAALEALRVQMERDRQAYERNKRLFNDKVISRSEFEQFEAAWRASQAQYNAARQGIRSQQAAVQSQRAQLSIANKNLQRATIVAPMDGVISALNVKKGERVVGTAQMAGTEMMTVADMSRLEVRVEVGENDIIKVGIGDSADVEVEAYNNRKFRGVVTQIASSTGQAATASANQATNYEVHIRLDPATYGDLVDPARPRAFPFRPGMNATADIHTRKEANVLSVPVTSVAAREKGTDKAAAETLARGEEDDEGSAEEAGTAAGQELEEVVFVVNKESKTEKRVVRTGIQDYNYIQILSGLNNGDQVISGPFNAVSKTLRSGTQVRVVPKEELFSTD